MMKKAYKKVICLLCVISAVLIFTVSVWGSPIIKMDEDESNASNQISPYVSITISNWYSDGDTVGYWSTAPTIYREALDTSSGFYFQIASLSAKNQWASALGLTLSQVSAEQADIKIYGGAETTLEETIDMDIEEGTAGVTLVWNDLKANVTCNGLAKRVYEMEAAIVCILDSDANRNNLELQKNTVTHEMGHALGYLEHALNSSDVMWHENHEGYLLTNNDIAHLTQIYDTFVTE